LPEDFYHKQHQYIYTAMKKLWDEKKTIDVVTISDELKKMDILDDIWGIDYLYELSTSVLTPSVANEYARIVKEKSTLRNILKVSQKIIWDIYSEKDVSEILNEIEKKIFDLTQINFADSLVHIRDILNQRIEDFVDRIISLISEIPLYKISKWILDEEDFAKLGQAMESISETDIYIDDKWWATIPELKSKLRRLKIEKWKLDLVIIDYLQLMSWVNSKFAWNRVQEIGEISRWLKELARELQIPIIALSQLSRAVEQRPDKRPQLADLRESWAIEQDADSVLMLYREDYYDPDTDRKWIADIFVRKNRNWPVWEVNLYFNREIMKFYDIANEEILTE